MSLRLAWLSLEHGYKFQNDLNLLHYILSLYSFSFTVGQRANGSQHLNCQCLIWFPNYCNFNCFWFHERCHLYLVLVAGFHFHRRCKFLQVLELIHCWLGLDVLKEWKQNLWRIWGLLMHLLHYSSLFFLMLDLNINIAHNVFYLADMISCNFLIS